MWSVDDSLIVDRDKDKNKFDTLDNTVRHHLFYDEIVNWPDYTDLLFPLDIDRL